MDTVNEIKELIIKFVYLKKYYKNNFFFNIKNNKKNLENCNNNLKCYKCNRQSNYIDKNTLHYLCWIHSIE